MVPFILSSFSCNVKNAKRERYERKLPHNRYKIILDQFFGTWTIIIGLSFERGIKRTPTLSHCGATMAVCREYLGESQAGKAVRDVLIASINILHRKPSISRKTIRGWRESCRVIPTPLLTPLFFPPRSSWRSDKPLEQLSRPIIRSIGEQRSKRSNFVSSSTVIRVMIFYLIVEGREGY